MEVSQPSLQLNHISGLFGGSGVNRALLNALTGRGAAGSSCHTWSIRVASGLLWLRLVHRDIFAASCCLKQSQHTWDHPKDENLHTPESKITVPFPAKYKKLN